MLLRTLAPTSMGRGVGEATHLGPSGVRHFALTEMDSDDEAEDKDVSEAVPAETARDWSFSVHRLTWTLSTRQVLIRTPRRF